MQRGNVDAVRCLLSAGADRDVLDTNLRRPPLYYAVERNNVAVAQLLTATGGTNASLLAYSGRTTPSSHAATKCSIQLLQPAINYRQLPACCPTGLYDFSSSLLTRFLNPFVGLMDPSVC